MKKSLLVLFIVFSWSCSIFAEEASVVSPTVRVGVLKFGTVNWLIDVIKHHQLDKKNGFVLKTTGLASKNASTLALQSKAVDIIVSDWLWVNRQRFEQRRYTLVPTSMVSGGIYVAPDAGIISVTDLVDKKIGIAGGAVDKNWLLFQAYAKQEFAIDVKKQAQANFMVPPLLNKLMLRGDISAAINFWHYGARLKAAGFKQLVSVQQMLQALGIKKQPPLLGWVFDETWAQDNQQAINGFLAAAKQAKNILYHSDEEWLRIRPLLKITKALKKEHKLTATNEQVFLALKTEYRAGSLQTFGAEQLTASQQLFEVLAQQGGSALVGKATHLHEGTFSR